MDPDLPLRTRISGIFKLHESYDHEVLNSSSIHSAKIITVKKFFEKIEKCFAIGNKAETNIIF